MSSEEQKQKWERYKSGTEDIFRFREFKITKTEDNDDYIDIYAEKKQEDGDKIKAIARFPKNPQIGVKTIRTLGKLQEEEELDEALLIAESALTHYAKKESVKLGIEIISSSNPLFNIFEHELVPQHIKLKAKEVKSFLSKYQIEKHQIPKILETDPAVKAIQAKAGDVVKIIRNPEMGEEGAYYRVIIKSSSRLRLTEQKVATKKGVTKKKTKPKPKEDTAPADEPKEDKTPAKPKEIAKKATPAKPKEIAKKATPAKPKETAKKATPAKKTTETKSKSKSPKIDISEINGIGSKTAELLKKHKFDTVQKLATAKKEDIEAIPGIGESTAKNIIKEAKKLSKK